MRNHERAGKKDTADAVIIGGGVIGLAIARALAMRNFGRVMVVERAGLGAEASWAAAGILAPQAEAENATPFFQLACASRDLYPMFAEALLEESGIDIELERSGTLYLAFDERDEEEIARRFKWQSQAALAVDRLSDVEALRLEPAISARVRLALHFPLDTQVENRRLVLALASAAERLGVQLVTGTNVESLIVRNDKIDGVQTSAGKVFSPLVIVAAGAWSSLLNVTDSPFCGPRIEPVRGQMLCFQSCPRLTRHIIYSQRGYLVPRVDGRLLAGSTMEMAGFDRRVTGLGVHAIMTNALEMLPAIADLPLVNNWAGLRPRAEDDLPVLGAWSQIHGLLYATGHFRNGILLAPITGEIIAQLATGDQSSPFMEAFGADRFNYVGQLSRGMF